jgi:hypothetical protein
MAAASSRPSRWPGAKLPILPRVALEYGHSWCAASTRAWATSCSRPGRLTLRRAEFAIHHRKHPAQKEQRADLGSLDIGSQGRRRRWERQAEFVQERTRLATVELLPTGMDPSIHSDVFARYERGVLEI